MRNLSSKFAFGFGLTTANIFADGANVIVKPLRVIRAVPVDFLNNRVFHNHASDTPINSSGAQITGRACPCESSFGCSLPIFARKTGVSIESEYRKTHYPHRHGLTTLQPIRSNGATSRVTMRWPRERAMSPMNESRNGNGAFAMAVSSPQIAAARWSKFSTLYVRGRLVANRLMLS